MTVKGGNERESIKDGSGIVQSLGTGDTEQVKGTIEEASGGAPSKRCREGVTGDRRLLQE